MTTKFGHLKELQVVPDAITKFPFPLIEGCPSLQVRHAGDSNSEFFNAVLKRNKHDERMLVEGETVDADHITRVRLADIELFIDMIVVGWGSVFDSKGKAVKFTKDNCRDFLTQLPVDMFNNLRAFCLNVNNFRARNTMSAEELEALQGN